MSGLTAAIILAREGMRVVVLEQHYRAGGLLHRFFRKGGRSYDVGFHYFGAVQPDQILGRYLRYCGVYDRLDLIPLDADGYDELRFPGRTVRIPAGTEALRDRLAAAFPTERAAVAKYVADMRAVCDGFGFYNLEPTVDPEHVDRWTSLRLADYLADLTADAQLRAVIAGQCPLYGVPPSQAPVALHALVTDTFLQRPHTIRGGGDALAQAMVGRLGQLGGEVETRQRVVSIEVDDAQRVAGVTTEGGEHYRAPLVISCAHPKVTLRLLPEHSVRPAYRRRVAAMRDGHGMLTVFATTPDDLSGYGARNVYLYDTWDLDSLFEPGDGSHRFAFVTAPSAREGPTRRGAHHAIGLGLLHASHVEPWSDTTTGARGDEYNAFKASQAEALRALMVRAIPELATSAVDLEAATPLTLRDFALSEGGAAYGIDHVVGQMGRHGLQPRTRVKGLYLTGQSVLLPGVCGVTISAFHTCSEILGREYLIGKVRAEVL
jgi:all-trans-retinol 13,14-reductase